MTASGAGTRSGRTISRLDKVDSRTKDLRLAIQARERRNVSRPAATARAGSGPSSPFAISSGFRNAPDRYPHSVRRAKVVDFPAPFGPPRIV